MIRAFKHFKPTIADSAYIDDSAVIIGQVAIGALSSVWPLTVIRGDVNQIIIGDSTNIQDGSVLHGTHDGPYTPGGHALNIGDEVTIGHHVVLHGATIDNRCLIGMGAMVMDGAYIEANTLIGAGSLVPQGKHLEGGYLWLGRPVKKIRPLSSEEIANIAYSAQHYVRLMSHYG